MNRPERTHTYSDMIYDSTRWNGFALREGDIVVATPPKCGTTWTQMICALLVHQAPDLPQPQTELSRWLERHGEPVETVHAHYRAQPFRRIVKTHTPLDGLRPARISANGAATAISSARPATASGAKC
ncbi:MAG TPA: sulfotransferase domain-containing protein [Rhizomicrobium sp.]|nr:sulfotransferase domain-containing protein [Rhizomicrobium sp.]